MPVFHTKTIQQVLEPVAMQVSDLVILHERSEDGAAMPPLEQPIKLVKNAVINLAEIGTQQVQTTTDEVLKIDAPKAIKKVNVASELLVEASKILACDNYSKEGREKLISGARGILQGTSDLLLVFDEKEVRRICYVCQGVRDYIIVSKEIRTVEDLVTFVKSLTPGIANMTKLVLKRSEDLTNLFHSEKLINKVNNIKTSLPNLISSFKSFVTTVASDNIARDASNENCRFYVNSIFEDITEIISVLQLVSTDVDVVLEKVYPIDLNEVYNNLVQSVASLKDNIENSSIKNDNSFYKAVSDIRYLADNAEDTKREVLYKKADDLIKNFELLKELNTLGTDNSTEAVALKQQFKENLNDIVHDIDDALRQIDIINSAKDIIATKTPILKEWLIDSGAKATAGSGYDLSKDIINAAKVIVQEKVGKIDSKAAKLKIHQICDEVDDCMQKVTEYREKDQGYLPEAREASKNCLNKIASLNSSLSEILGKTVNTNSIVSKIESINNWLDDPDVNDNGEGILAGEKLIALAQGLAGDIKKAQLQTQLLQKAKECKQLSAELNELQRSGCGSSPEAYQLAKELKTKFLELKELTENALVEATGEDFSNSSAVLDQFNKTAIADKTVPTREEDFAQSISALKMQALKVATVGRQAVSMSKYGSEEKVEKFTASANKLIKLTPQVINAGTVVFASPENLQAKEHLKALCNEWTENVDNLTLQVDNAVDVQKFLHASKESILHEKEKCSAAMLVNEPGIVLANVGKIARQANRVLMVGKQETENIDDKSYVDDLNNHLVHVEKAINPVITAAHEYDENPLSENTKSTLESKNDELVDAISNLCETVETRYVQEKLQTSKVCEVEEKPLCPPLPIDEEAPPRPPLPEDEEEEDFPDDDDDNEHLMMQAARELHEETVKWEARGNDVISSAKRMALLMAKMSQLVGSEKGKKSDLIACAKDIAKASGEVTALTLEVAEKCTDKRIKNDLKKTLDRIPTISTQLRILSTVKAASLGDKDDMTKEEEDEADQATEMLVLNAQNLMMSVKDAVRYAEAASIRIRSDAAGTVKWVRK